MSENCLSKRPELNIRNIDQETVIVDKETGEVHQLNPTASYIWDQFDGATTIEQITSKLANEFNIDENQAALDVNAVVDQLKELKLLIMQ